MLEFEKGNRQDLVDQSKAEIEILLDYLPQQLSENEIFEIIKQTAVEVGANSIKDMAGVRPGRRSPTGGLDALGAGQHGLVRRDNPGGCYPGSAADPTEVPGRSPSPSGTASSRCWRKASNRPVLKHGPRSLTCVRAGGCEAHEAQVT